jgi:two-component system cell cycle sensor histidine kinase/response regulator CckA
MSLPPLPPIVAPETILVVDDMPVVLSGVSSILKKAGFTVLSASSPEEAIKISQEFTGTIDLLLSDVMMPNMSGPDLAKKLVEQRKELRVMLMTGYDAGDLLLLNYGWHLIKKPFVPVLLREKVNAILHSPNRSQGTDHFDTSPEETKRTQLA